MLNKDISMTSTHIEIKHTELAANGTLLYTRIIIKNFDQRCNIRLFVRVTSVSGHTVVHIYFDKKKHYSKIMMSQLVYVTTDFSALT